MRDGGRDLVHLADMAGVTFGAEALVADGLCDGLAPFGLAAGTDHVRAMLGQQVGDGLTDAAAGPGDEGDAAREVE